MVPDRRSLVVLVGLVGAMTLSSVLLLVLEPGPTSPPLSVVGLRSHWQNGQFDQNLFDTAPPSQPRRWSAIMIYESGSLTGTAESIVADHKAMGLGGLGYHFVIEHGPDEQRTTRSGFRWRHQLPGAVATGRYREGTNQHALSICLVGNSDLRTPSDAQMRDLVQLIHRLQWRFQIPSHRVRLHGRPGKHFPVGRLRDQLLTVKPSP